MRRVLLLPCIFLFTPKLRSDEVDIRSFHTDNSEVVASSVLHEEGKSKDLYAPKNASDGDAKTAWCSNAANGGSGEWIEFRARRSGPFRLRGIALSNGYTASKAQYYANNRVKNIQVTVTKINGRQRVFRKKMTDTFTRPEFDEITRDHVIFGPCKIGDSEDKTESDCFWHDIAKIRITILSVYEGNKHNDTCISEVRWLQ